MALTVLALPTLLSLVDGAREAVRAVLTLEGHGEELHGCVWEEAPARASQALESWEGVTVTDHALPTPEQHSSLKGISSQKSRMGNGAEERETEEMCGEEGDGVGQKASPSTAQERGGTGCAWRCLRSSGRVRPSLRKS